MNVTPKVVTSPIPANKSKQGQTDRARAAVNFDTFLTLLTTQLKNQDPLKPLESTQFVAQLASFSAVEQQVRTNDNLKQIKTMLGGGSVQQLASWVGLNVRSPRDVYFSGSPIKIQIKPASGAEQAMLVVKDQTGAEVQRQNVDAGGGVITWQGLRAGGARFPRGKYSFLVESFKGGKMIADKSPSIYGRVTEARLNGGDIELVLADGTVVQASRIDAVKK